MRKTYVTPTMNIEAFQPTEYVAACDPKTYIAFTCIPGEVWSETNGLNGLQKTPGTADDGSHYESDRFVGRHDCSEVHKIYPSLITGILNYFSPAYVITDQNETINISRADINSSLGVNMHYGKKGQEHPNYS